MPSLFKLIDAADEVKIEEGPIGFEVDLLAQVGVTYLLGAWGGDLRWELLDQEVQLIDGRTSANDVNGEAVELSFVMVTRRPMADTDLGA